MAPFPLLANPFRLGTLELPNRMVMSPMSSGLGAADGSVTDAQLAYYGARADGGVGMIIVEFTAVDRGFGLAEPHQLSLEGGDRIAGHRRLVERIAASGCRPALQLHAAGRFVDRSTIEGLPVAPSPVVSRRDGRLVARELGEAEIWLVVSHFARAAHFALEAGYQAIEIHGAHGYLPMAFLSPLSNSRLDAWGGDPERRSRFAIEIVRAVKSVTGDRVPLLYRLSAAECLPGGLTIDDMEAVAPRLAAAGVDAFDVSSGSLAGALDMTIDPMSMPEAWRFGLSRRIRLAGGVPVVGIGPVRWPSTAEAAIREGSADLIALGRPLLADPQWPGKALGRDPGPLRACTNCNWCVDRVARKLPIACAEHPTTGAELDPPPPRLEGRPTAVVVGGGPGGLAAALELDEAGCRTILIEQRDRLGGGLIASSAPPLKERIGWFLDYLLARLERSAVTVRCGRPADVRALVSIAPDLVVVAVGATPVPSAIPGATLPTVLDAYALLMGDEPGFAASELPVIVYGGGETGCEAAEYLAARDLDVLLVTRSPVGKLARSAEAMYRKHLVSRIRANPRIGVIDNATIVDIEPAAVGVSYADGRTARLAARAVVLAQGRSPHGRLVEQLRAAGIRVAVIGDAGRVARIGDAVHSAHNAVREFLADAR